MTPEEKQQNFHKELKQLLKKYKANLSLEDFGTGYYRDDKIVVEFDYDGSLYTDNETGIIPDLVLGTYEDGSSDEKKEVK